MKKINIFFSISLILVFFSFLFYLFLAPVFRISSIEIHFDKALKQNNSYKKTKSELGLFLEKYKGRRIWEVKLKPLVQVLGRAYPGFKIQVYRRFPGHLVFFLKRDETALLLFDKGRFFYVSSEGKQSPLTNLDGFLDFPVLRGKFFFDSLQLRKKVLNIVRSLPKTGPFFSYENLSEILYSEKKDSLLFYLIKGNYVLELNPDGLDSEKIKNILFVLKYLEKAKDKRKWIDVRFDKKIIVKKKP